LPNIVCFHSQQAVEKSLKALYLHYFATVPKTHNIEVVFTKLKKKIPEISKFEEKIRYLNKFYVPTRYPDALPGSLPEGLPKPDEAKIAVEFAKEILSSILELPQILSQI
jgi:HEPN domain-containing protein